MGFPAHYTWAERMHGIRARYLTENALALPEWEPDTGDDEYPHEVVLTANIGARPPDRRTEQRMLRRPAPW